MEQISRKAKIYVRNKSDRKIFYIEERYSSLVWTERYQEAGEFVLDIPLNAANLDVYKIGNYISFDNSKESMIIESRTINDETDEPTLEISGRTLSSILTRRVNASKVFDLMNGSISYSGNPGEIMQTIFNDEIINPSLPTYMYMHDPENDPLTFNHPTLVAGYYEPGGSWGTFLRYNVIRRTTIAANYRKINGFIFKNSVPSGTQASVSFDKIETLYDIMVKLSKNNYLGFRSYFDDNLNIVIELFQGVNRTTSQKTLTPVVFDPIMDNISYLGYFEDATEYKNGGFVYSDGTLFYRKKYDNGDYPRYDIYPGYTWYEVNGSTTSDLDRFEVPFDVRNEVSVKDLEENVDPELYYGSESTEGTDGSSVSTSGWSSSEWYAWFDKIQASVLNSGISQYEDGEYGLVQTSEGTIDPLVRYKFEEDYNIGDKVDITNGDYGIAMTAYIDEAVKSYDSNGWIITPNFKNILDYDYGEEEDQ